MQASDFTHIVPPCCAEVLESMYFATVFETSNHPGVQPSVEPGQLAFSLRFDGDLHGSFGVALHLSLARTLAANFLGEEEKALTGVEVAEVIGELANMFCGSVVSRIESASKFALSHPVPFAESLPSLDVLTSEIETDGGVVRTWIAIDPPSAVIHAAYIEALQAKP